MTATEGPTSPGAFLQLIEYRTDHGEQMEDIIARWVGAIGAKRTARWYVTTADRDRPRDFVQIVEFPDYAAAMANSDHPATAEFADALDKICDDGVIFRNLDVVVATRL